MPPCNSTPCYVNRFPSYNNSYDNAGKKTKKKKQVRANTSITSWIGRKLHYRNKNITIGVWLKSFLTLSTIRNSERFYIFPLVLFLTEYNSSVTLAFGNVSLFLNLRTIHLTVAGVELCLFNTSHSTYWYSKQPPHLSSFFSWLAWEPGS